MPAFFYNIRFNPGWKRLETPSRPLRSPRANVNAVRLRYPHIGLADIVFQVRGDHDHSQSTGCFCGNSLCICGCVSACARGDILARAGRRRSAILRVAGRDRRCRQFAAGLQVFRLSGMPAGGGWPTRQLRTEHRLPRRCFLGDGASPKEAALGNWMTIDRTAKASTAVILACTAVAALTSSATPVAAKSGAPPFCVMTGGPRGPGTVPQLCRFFDYQDCLLAAADLHGNCVQNIDYRGEIPSSPAPARTRQRRY